jgi:pimeloyl-ACP methyl ester carboxylesterase
VTTHPELRLIDPQPAAAVRAETTRDGIAAVVDRAFPALFQRLGAVGVAPAGPPFIRYLETGERFVLELGVPVPEGVDRDLEDSSLPGGRVAVLRHIGPYDELPQAFERLRDWVTARGEQIAGPGWESYMTDPRTEPDPSSWVTDVYLPVRMTQESTTLRDAAGESGTITSADGTTIAFRRLGDGAPLVIVGGAFNDGATAAPLAELLAGSFAVYTYDRRGRGSSGDTAPYAPDREIEDLHVLIARAGGSVHLFGHSSGAVLALRATAASANGAVAKLALYEPPFTADRGLPPDALDNVLAMIAEDRRGDAVAEFLRVGPQVPDAVIAQMRQTPVWAGFERIAHTLPYDMAVVGDGRVPTELAAGVRVPVLVMDGGLSPSWAQKAVTDLAGALPNASHKRFEDQDHGVAPAVLAPVLKRFFS